MKEHVTRPLLLGNLVCKMADDKANIWKLYYWPKLAGRAEFLRVIFEEAGVQFEEINDLEVLVPMFRECKVCKVESCHFEVSTLGRC